METAVIGKEFFELSPRAAPQRSPEPEQKGGNGSDRGEPRAQYGALPLARDADGSLKVLLVTSRETRRWVIPKGWPIKGMKPYRVAAREAYEEAGLVGEVGKRALGSYTYQKTLKNRDSVTCLVEVYPFRVRKRLKRWPEKKQRESRWFSLEAAAEAVQEAGLGDLVRGMEPSPETREAAAAR